jgi:ligand-binding sensor domain-containing protein
LYRLINLILLTYHFMRVSFFIILAFFSGSLAAQVPAYRNISVQQGLSSNEVYDILQDRKGYMWFSTDAGVCRYNGSDMKVFTTADGLSDNVVFGLYEDRKGRIWFRTLNNTICYYYEGRIHSIGANGVLSQMKRLPANNGLFVDSGDTLWLGVNVHALVKIPPANNYASLTNVYLIPEDSGRHVIVQEPDGNGSVEGGSLVDMPISNVSFFLRGRRIDLHLGEVKEFNPSQRGHTITLADGRIAFPFGNNIYLLNADGTFTRYVAASRPQDIYEDKQGGFWAGLFVNGLLYFPGSDMNRPPVRLFDQVTISKIYMDYEGGVWCGSIGKGVYYIPSLDLKKIVPLLKEDMAGINPLRFIKSDDGLLKVRTLDNAYYTIQSKPESINLQKEMPAVGPVKYFNGFRFQGRPLLTVRKGNRTREVLFTNTLTGRTGALSNADNFYVHANNVMTFFASNSLFCFQPDLSVTRVEAPWRINTTVITATGRIFIGTNYGLSELVNDKLIAITKPSPLFAGRINHLEEDNRGRLWMASRQNGIIIWDQDSLVLQLDTKKGMPTNAVRELVIDAHNNVWAATNRGICKIIPEGDSFRIMSVNTADGLESNDINCIAYRNGLIYAGTRDAIHFFDTGIALLNKQPPRVNIAGVEVNEKAVSGTAVLQLGHAENNIRISFDNLSFRSETNRRFRYRLEGYDGEWRYSSRGTAEYTNLPGGTYRFLVFAINSDGTESRAPAMFTFHIDTAYWKTWWFMALLFLLGLLIFYWLIRFWLNYQRRREAEKQQLESMIAEYRMTALRAQMNPHFIFNVITSIQHYVLENNRMASYDFLSKFGRLMRLVLENSKQKDISLARELETLQLYIELEQLRLNNAFVFSLQLQDDIDTEATRVPTMLVQPYIENAIKHGLAPLPAGGLLNLVLTIKGESLQMAVDDNGVGRMASQALRKKENHLSMGMDITIDRIRLLSRWHNKQFEVNIEDKYSADGKPEGTRVLITIPLFTQSN